LPRRVVIGPEYRFGLEDTFATDATVVNDLVHMEMRDGGGVIFFADDTAERGEELFFIYLELKDRSKTATVSASYVEQALDGTRCARTVEQTITGVRRIYFPPRCQEGRYKPRSVIVFCADAGMILRKIRWRHWNDPVATGRARAWANTCEPSCVEGRFIRYQVAVSVRRTDAATTQANTSTRASGLRSCKEGAATHRQFECRYGVPEQGRRATDVTECRGIRGKTAASPHEDA